MYFKYYTTLHAACSNSIRTMARTVLMYVKKPPSPNYYIYKFILHLREMILIRNTANTFKSNM